MRIDLQNRRTDKVLWAIRDDSGRVLAAGTDGSKRAAMVAAEKEKKRIEKAKAQKADA